MSRYTHYSLWEIKHRVTLSWYNRLIQFWEQEPPVDILVAKFLGFEPEVRTDSQPTWETESFEDMRARWQAIVGTEVQ